MRFSGQGLGELAQNPEVDADDPVGLPEPPAIGRVREERDRAASMLKAPDGSDDQKLPRASS